MNESSNCIFCNIIAGKIPCTKVYEDEHTFAFLDIKPVKPGHTLVISKKHFRSIFDCPPEVLNHLINTVQKLSKNYPCVRIVQNNGAPIQEVFHIHFHVIPQ